VVLTMLVVLFSSTFVAAIRIVLPGVEVPVSVTGLFTIVRSVGAVTVSVVWPWVLRT
jgi:hypothetical protein